MIGIHRFDQSDLDALAAGLGDVRVVRLLRAGQLSKRMLQLRMLLDLAASPEVNRHFAVLTAAVRRAPEVGPAVMSLPHTGAWLTATLRRLRADRPDPALPTEPDRAVPPQAHRITAVSDAQPPRRVDVDLSHLGAIAATAAIRAGIDFEVAVLPREGMVFLPSLGRASVGDVDRVTVSGASGRVRVGRIDVPLDTAAEAGAGSGGWAGLHHLRRSFDGLAIEVCLDDLDPYRDCHALSATDRLDPATVVGWQRLLDEAWPILVRHHRRHAEAIGEGLRTIVPLRTGSASAGVNVTSMDAFGAVSMTRPVDAAALALGLLHEFQHAKLGATIDVTPLHHRDDRRYYYAPWRDDPRPLGAAMHGVYAFIAVTEFWRARRVLLTGGQARLAEAEFARWRERVSRTCAELESSDRLTLAGRRFVDGMRAVIDGWRDEVVSPEAAELAREAAEDHWTGWRLRNRRPDPESVNRLAAAWRNGGPCAPLAVPVRVEPADGRWLSRSPRLDLVRLRLTDPDRFGRLRAGVDRLADVLPEASAGDLALAGGDHEAARECYRRQIMEEGDRLSPWVGLTLACERATDTDGTTLYAPEMCRAVHRALAADGMPVDPVELARWLAPVACVPDPDLPAVDGSGSGGAGTTGATGLTSAAVPGRS